MSDIINPSGFLKEQIGQSVLIKLKWGSSYTGTLVSCDSFMNLQLRNAVEHIPGNEPEDLGELVLRCNNVLYIRKQDA